MSYILTFDVGTTAMKATIFDESLNIISQINKEYDLIMPNKDYVELDSEVYWYTLKEAIQEMVTCEISQQIKVVTITTQGETLIPVDIEGNPLSNAIVWLDARALEEADFLNSQILSDEFYPITGMPEISPAMPVAKLLWLKSKRPEIYKNTHKFLLLEDFLINKLTSKFVSEHSLLSSTGYFDINNNQYFTKILEAFDFDLAKLPTIMKSAEIVGNITTKAACETGLSTNTLVSTGAMDQISSAVGAGNIKPGIVTETTGTALVIVASVQTPNYNNTEKMQVYRHYDNSYVYMPYCATAGIILKWFKDQFLKSELTSSDMRGEGNGISIYQRIDDMVENTYNGANGLILIPHFAGKMVPDSNPKATGVFYGVGLDTKREDFLRAIFEGIAFMLKENLDFLNQFGVEINEIHSLGGASKSKVWSQIKSDICQKPILVMENSETTSIGAAIIGGLSIKLFDSAQEACDKIVKVKSKYDPSNIGKQTYEESYAKYLDVYNRLK